MQLSTFRVGITRLALIVGAVAFAWWFYHQILPASVNQPTSGLMSAADTQSRAEDEDNIAEVVFRYQMNDCFPGRQRQVYFLRRAKDDPSDRFMKRFEGDTPPVKKFSQSTKLSDGLADKDSRQPGILLGVAKIEWDDAAKVTVIGSCFADTENVMEYVYEVIREGKQWVVKGRKITLTT